MDSWLEENRLRIHLHGLRERKGECGWSSIGLRDYLYGLEGEYPTHTHTRTHAHTHTHTQMDLAMARLPLPSITEDIDLFDNEQTNTHRETFGLQKNSVIYLGTI